MNNDLEFTMDDFETKEANAESNQEATSEEIETKGAESTTEAEAESTSKEEGKPAEQKAGEDKPEGEDSGAESPKAEEYTPDFSYSIKDEKHEFPEWVRDVVKTKEQEDYLRDLHTKAFALDGIKESRDRFETELNNMNQSIENEIYPIFDRIKEFDMANEMRDFSKAWELSSVDPKDVVDYMLMDKDLSELVYTKVLEQFQMQEQGGPQALEAKRQAFEEQKRSRELELNNKTLEGRLKQIEEANFEQNLDFVLNQQAESVNKYEAINGQGSFKQFVKDYNFMLKSKNQNMTPVELVNHSLKMLGLNGQANSTQSGTQETVNMQAKVQPQATKRPEALPNIGTGSNVSMVQEQATTWDEWSKSMGNGF